MIAAHQGTTSGTWMPIVVPPNKVGPWDDKQSKENEGSSARDITADIQMPDNDLQLQYFHEQ